jgi:hypothetical protein
MSADDLSLTDSSSSSSSSVAEADSARGRSTRAASADLERRTAAYCSMQRAMYDY